MTNLSLHDYDSESGDWNMKIFSRCCNNCAQKPISTMMILRKHWWQQVRPREAPI